MSKEFDLKAAGVVIASPEPPKPPEKPKPKAKAVIAATYVAIDATPLTYSNSPTDYSSIFGYAAGSGQKLHTWQNTIGASTIATQTTTSAVVQSGWIPDAARLPANWYVTGYSTSTNTGFGSGMRIEVQLAFSGSGRTVRVDREVPSDGSAPDWSWLAAFLAGVEQVPIDADANVSRY